MPGSSRRRAVRVGDDVLTAERIFINVGGRAADSADPGPRRRAVLNNSSMMEVDFVPPHLVVIGGSYIGLEFAQMYRRFGSARHDRRDVAVPDRARGRGHVHGHPRDPRGRGRRRAHGRRVHLRREDAVGRARGRQLPGRRARRGWDAHPARRRAAAPTPTTSVSTRPASRSTRAATSRWTISCARTCPGSGRSAIATAAAPSPTPPTTTSRSSRRTCSTTTRGALSDRIDTYAPLHRPAARARRA